MTVFEFPRNDTKTVISRITGTVHSQCNEEKTQQVIHCQPKMASLRCFGRVCSETAPELNERFENEVLAKLKRTGLEFVLRYSRCLQRRLINSGREIMILFCQIVLNLLLWKTDVGIAKIIVDL